MTISATGDRRAFTLVEVLLAIALIALMAVVLVGGASSLLEGRTVSADDQFWKVCGEARKAALESEQPVVVGSDAQAHGYTVTGPSGARTVPWSSSKDVAVDFLAPRSSGASSVLIGGTVVETRTLPSVTFYPDGTCTPFRAQVRATGSAHVIEIDPWTCAAVLTPHDTP